MSNELYESAQSSQQPIFADDDDEKGSPKSVLHDLLPVHHYVGGFSLCDIPFGLSQGLPRLMTTVFTEEVLHSLAKR